MTDFRADKILEWMGISARNILQGKVAENGIDIRDYISSDKSCNYRSGTAKFVLTDACIACRKVSSLVPEQQITLSKHFKIATGGNRGLTMEIIKATNDPITKYELTESNFLVNIDVAVHKSLIGLMLSRELSKFSNLKTTQLGMYECGNVLYSVKHPIVKSIITPSKIPSIIDAIKDLRKFHYLHVTPSAHCFNFTNDNIYLDPTSGSTVSFVIDDEKYTFSSLDPVNGYIDETGINCHHDPVNVWSEEQNEWETYCVFVSLCSVDSIYRFFEFDVLCKIFDVSIASKIKERVSETPLTFTQVQSVMEGERLHMGILHRVEENFRRLSGM